MRNFPFITFAIASVLKWNGSHALPAGFIDEEITGNLGSPIQFTFAPGVNGAPPVLLTTSQNGLIRAIDDVDNFALSSPIISADLTNSTCSSSTSGLMGIEIHPNFIFNRYVYVYYTYHDSVNLGPCNTTCTMSSSQCPALPQNRLSRFVMNSDNTFDMDSEQVLLQTPPCADHNSGSIKFGPDGYLYISIGDGQKPYAPRSNLTSQHPGNLYAYIVRLTDDGGIPPDNPFTVANGYASSSERCNIGGETTTDGNFCQEIFMYGFRQPFQLAMDPNRDKKSIRFYINECGQNTWEWIYEGGPHVAGKRGGWPNREGPCLFGSSTECAVDDNFLDPVYYYNHFGSGACLTGGAFVPHGVWPAKFTNGYLIADFILNEMRLLLPNPGNECRTCNLPRPSFSEELFDGIATVVSIAFGPYKGSQALYYTQFWNNPRRIVYIGENNTPPIARLTVTSGNSTVESGENVYFAAENSTDADGDTLKYEWYFGDNSSPLIAGGKVAHSYETEGVYFASVIVSDGSGGRDRAYVKITVTPHMPSPSPSWKCCIPILSHFVSSCHGCKRRHHFF